MHSWTWHLKRVYKYILKDKKKKIPKFCFFIFCLSFLWSCAPTLLRVNFSSENEGKSVLLCVYFWPVIMMMMKLVLSLRIPLNKKKKWVYKKKKRGENALLWLLLLLLLLLFKRKKKMMKKKQVVVIIIQDDPAWRWLETALLPTLHESFLQHDVQTYNLVRSPRIRHLLKE